MSGELDYSQAQSSYADASTHYEDISEVEKGNLTIEELIERVSIQQARKRENLASNIIPMPEIISDSEINKLQTRANQLAVKVAIDNKKTASTNIEKKEVMSADESVTLELKSNWNSIMKNLPLQYNELKPENVAKAITEISSAEISILSHFVIELDNINNNPSIRQETKDQYARVKQKISQIKGKNNNERALKINKYLTENLPEPYLRTYNSLYKKKGSLPDPETIWKKYNGSNTSYEVFRVQYTAQQNIVINHIKFLNNQEIKTLDGFLEQKKSYMVNKAQEYKSSNPSFYNILKAYENKTPQHLNQKDMELLHSLSKETFYKNEKDYLDDQIQGIKKAHTKSKKQGGTINDFVDKKNKLWYDDQLTTYAAHSIASELVNILDTSNDPRWKAEKNKEVNEVSIIDPDRANLPPADWEQAGYIGNLTLRNAAVGLGGIWGVLTVAANVMASFGGEGNPIENMIKNPWIYGGALATGLSYHTLISGRLDAAINPENAGNILYNNGTEEIKMAKQRFFYKKENVEFLQRLNFNEVKKDRWKTAFDKMKEEKEEEIKEINKNSNDKTQMIRGKTKADFLKSISKDDFKEHFGENFFLNGREKSFPESMNEKDLYLILKQVTSSIGQAHSWVPHFDTFHLMAQKQVNNKTR